MLFLMILVTGFEPFTTGQGLKLVHNPTADIAMATADRLELARAAVLPVSFEKTKTSLMSHLETLKPKIWLGLGYAPHRETLDIETIALNLAHAESGDNDGATPWMQPIFENAPTAYRTRLDERMAVTLFIRHGLPAKAAVHAGTFLCNQSFFIGCHQVERQESLKLAAFIHVPPLGDFKSFEDALVELLQTLDLET